MSEFPILSDDALLETTKDFIIILLSVLALFSTYIQSKKTKRNEWINGFRIQVSKMISLISRDIDKNNEINIHEVFLCMTLINLYINHTDPNHTKIITEINELKNEFKEFFKERSNSEKIGLKIVQIVQTAKKIIDIEDSKFF